jgi:hypothetical protein
VGSKRERITAESDHPPAPVTTEPDLTPVATMLAARARHDECEARIAQLAAKYGNNRAAKRRARVEVKRARRPKTRVR